MFKITIGLVLFFMTTLCHADYCKEGQWLEIAKELGYTDEDDYQRFSDCKVMPSDPYKAIIVFSKHDQEDYCNLDVLIVSTETGKILSRLSEVKVNSYYAPSRSIQSIYIDTARYKLAEGIRAFGVGVSRSNNSRTTVKDTILNLFVEKGNKINHILKNIIISSGFEEYYSGQYCEEDCEEDKTLKSPNTRKTPAIKKTPISTLPSSYTTRTISIGKTFANGYADLVVSSGTIVGEKNFYTRDSKSECIEEVEKKKTTFNRYILHFDGKKYVVPKKLSAE